MLTQMLDRMIEQDPVLLAQRTADARRYIVSRWKQKHDSPIKQEAVALFLCDEMQGALTEAQRIFAKENERKCSPVTALWCFGCSCAERQCVCAWYLDQKITVRCFHLWEMLQSHPGCRCEGLCALEGAGTSPCPS